MSSPSKYTLIITAEANEDYEDIMAYTLVTGGVDQLSIYDDKIQEALTIITQDPQRGRKHKKLSSHLRYYHVGRHFIIYQIEATTVQVLRILHENMDISRHVP
jgi:toxin ParE1/3/4